ncbi:MAG TPA: hypothetical protein VG714_02715 [Acidobacteriaceae bacterium]|nr:hypothetical protein [Acidobacteriaceae bacterium]
MTGETQWSAGRLARWSGPHAGHHRLLFGQMYEDAAIELDAFRDARRIFCIASAGDTAIRLSRDHEVIACDINPVQLAYARRRALGGPRETGDADRIMHLMRRLMPLVGWTSARIRTFLALSDPAAQLAFWQQHLDNRRLRVGLSIAMSRPALRTVYAREFLSLIPPHFGAVLRKRLQRGIGLHPNASNPYLRSLLTGEATQLPPPASAIQFLSGDAATVLEACAPASLDGFTLSNILDGAGSAYRVRLAQAVRRAATPDALVVLRSFSEPPAAMDANRAACDRSMLWGVVEVRRALNFF